MPRPPRWTFTGKKQKLKKCLDCPSMIPNYGNKDRCAPCASNHYQHLKNERARAKRKAKQQEAGDCE